MGKKSLKRVLKKQQTRLKKNDHRVRGKQWLRMLNKEGKPQKCQYCGKRHVKVDVPKGISHCESCGGEIMSVY